MWHESQRNREAVGCWADIWQRNDLANPHTISVGRVTTERADALGRAIFDCGITSCAAATNRRGRQITVCGHAISCVGRFFPNCVPQINASVTVHGEMPGLGAERVGQMAGKHRRMSGRTKKIATMGVATMTATALTVGVAPPPRDHVNQLAEDVDLMAAINPWPAPGDIPDLTGGLGSAVYGSGQAIADVLIRALVENLNAAALAQAAGLSPDAVLDTLLGGLLGQLPANLLNDIIGELPIDISGVVAALLAPLGQAAADLVGDLVAGALPNTLGGLLGLLGLDLGDVLNLSDLNVPGLNIITAGPPFTLLKMLGADLGWVPGLPNSIASEINNSPYLDLEVGLSDLLGSLPVVGPTVVGSTEWTWHQHSRPRYRRGPGVGRGRIRARGVRRRDGLRAGGGRPGQSARRRTDGVRTPAARKHHGAPNDPAAQPRPRQRRLFRALLSVGGTVRNRHGHTGDRGKRQRRHTAAQYRAAPWRRQLDSHQGRRHRHVRSAFRLRGVAQPVLARE